MVIPLFGAKISPHPLHLLRDWHGLSVGRQQPQASLEVPPPPTGREPGARLEMQPYFGVLGWEKLL